MRRGPIVCIDVDQCVTRESAVVVLIVLIAPCEHPVAHDQIGTHRESGGDLVADPHLEHLPRDAGEPGSRQHLDRSVFIRAGILRAVLQKGGLERRVGQTVMRCDRE